MRYYQIVEDMLTYFKNDVARINHALKVYSFSKIISEKESITKKKSQVIYIAAIFHDIGIKKAEEKYSSFAGEYQEQEGPPVAREILDQYDFSDNILDRVCFLIGNHHSYDKIDGIDFQILVEADFLVNIFDENMSSQQIESIKDNIFKTETREFLLREMYLT